MRDLRSDFEFLESGFHPSGVELVEIAKYAVEKALDAENLVRNLVGVIDELLRQINGCGLDGEMWEVYKTAKEALGDR